MRKYFKDVNREFDEFRANAHRICTGDKQGARKVLHKLPFPFRAIKCCTDQMAISSRTRDISGHGRDGTVWYGIVTCGMVWRCGKVHKVHSVACYGAVCNVVVCPTLG